jgi:hypothetical protein
MLPTVVVCVILAVCAPGALGATRTQVFHPRVGRALGLIPPVASRGPIRTLPGEEGQATPLIYRAGHVMTGGVTVHTIFWAPKGFSFQGSPGAGVPTYKGLIEQFYTDVAKSSLGASKCDSPTNPCNVFTNLTQYAQGALGGSITPGEYNIGYTPLADSIEDHEPYPSPACVSPSAAKACVTDEQVQEQVTKVIEESGAEAGLHNLWFVFLPPNVDECAEPGVCGTNAFLGYHSLTHLGPEATVYAVAIDPIIEIGSVAPGGDPQGNPDAEVALDVAAHETEEAITDPEGTGWVDPNGYEVGDKCEFGPQHGTPLGFATDGSPYDQVINEHQYLLQMMWSDDDGGCVQGTSESGSPLPLPEVNLTQFSPVVSGRINHETAGVKVTVSLLRQGAGGSPVVVASESATTEANGSWKLTLSHAVGDDRDRIDVAYSGAGAPTPHHQVILTGNGGPIQEGSGWTGWTDLDNGSALFEEGLVLAPCFQVGVLSYAVNGVAGTVAPNEFCNSKNIAEVGFPKIVHSSEAVTVTSDDNRAFAPSNIEGEEPNPTGGLVKLTVPVGEPEAFSSFPNPVGEFLPTGFPTCHAQLNAQTVTCTGLREHESYALTDGVQKVTVESDETGTLTASLSVKAGDVIALSNSAKRTLTALHVANLKVNIAGNSDVVASGTCSPDEYWGGPISSPFASEQAAEPSAVAGGPALTGEICPLSGSAAGLPTAEIGQTDELSGGATFTSVSTLANTSPMEAETMYGTFTALAEASEGTPPIALSISKSGGGPVVFGASNVDTTGGASVSALESGTYTATWTIGDPNGDTRTVTTRFIEQPALQGPGGNQGKTGPQGVTGAQGPTGPRGPAGPKPSVSCKLTGKKHNKIRCTVKFPTSTHGVVQLSISRGAHVAALGHGQLRHGATTVTMRELRRLNAGAWTLTIVLSAGHRHAQTSTLKVHMP